jgi:hypothetical protein
MHKAVKKVGYAMTEESSKDIVFLRVIAAVNLAMGGWVLPLFFLIGPGDILLLIGVLIFDTVIIVGDKMARWKTAKFIFTYMAAPFAIGLSAVPIVYAFFWALI